MKSPFSCCQTSKPPFTTPRPYRVFTHEELSEATSDFSSTFLLGRGSYGSVYLASLDSGHLKAAAKLPSTSSPSTSEISLLSSLPRSQFLVNFLGSTSSPPLIPVFDLMPNGSLHTLLHNPLLPPPDFRSRLRLSYLASASLSHLHSLHIVHRDVKPSNLLLDVKNRPRLADFGLAIRLNSSHPLPAPSGTMGYLDPSYTNPEDVGTRVDVYSFGVVLFEILSGRKGIDVDYSPPGLVEWATRVVDEGRFDELWDPRELPVGAEEEKAGRAIAEVARRCVYEDSESRPAMAEVFSKLRDVERRVKRLRRWSARWKRGGAQMGARTGRVADVAS